MTYPDPSPERRTMRLPRGTWLALALVVGAAPWVTGVIVLLWPALMP